MNTITKAWLGSACRWELRNCIHYTYTRIQCVGRWPELRWMSTVEKYIYFYMHPRKQTSRNFIHTIYFRIVWGVFNVFQHLACNRLYIVILQISLDAGSTFRCKLAILCVTKENLVVVLRYMRCRFLTKLKRERRVCWIRDQIAVI